MAVALIAATGAIIVALISSVVSQRAANNVRTVLLKDLEILSKLDEGSKERRQMEEHVRWEVLSLTTTDTLGGIRLLRNRRIARVTGWLLFALSSTSAIVLLAYDSGRFKYLAAILIVAGVGCLLLTRSLTRLKILLEETGDSDSAPSPPTSGQPE
jgi:hypothetical protein